MFTVTMTIASNWASGDQQENRRHLELKYGQAIQALAEVDAAGHRFLLRMGSGPRATQPDELVAMVLLRRLVTHFTGIRSLLLAASVEPAKVITRAQLEALMALRYLVYGGRRSITPLPPTYARARVARANYYLASTLKREIERRERYLSGKLGRVSLGKDLRKEIRHAIQVRQAFLARKYPSQARRFAQINRRRFADWYEFGFPSGKVRSIGTLARRMGWGIAYEFLYDGFSALTHPRGIEHDVEINEGEATVLSPHLVDAFEIVARYSVTFQLFAFGLMVKAYLPGSEPDLARLRRQIAPTIQRLDVDLPRSFLA